jgi:amino acid transporter
MGQVYLEFGTAIPRNGGEKNYLEYVFRRPKFLATGFYTGYVVLLGMCILCCLCDVSLTRIRLGWVQFHRVR